MSNLKCAIAIKNDQFVNFLGLIISSSSWLRFCAFDWLKVAEWWGTQEVISHVTCLSQSEAHNLCQYEEEAEMMMHSNI